MDYWFSHCAINYHVPFSFHVSPVHSPCPRVFILSILFLNVGCVSLQVGVCVQREREMVNLFKF